MPTHRRRLSEYKGQPFPDDTEFVVEMIVSEQTRARGSDETRKVVLHSLLWLTLSLVHAV